MMETVNRIKSVKVEILIEDKLINLDFKSKDSSENLFCTKENIKIKAILVKDIKCYNAKRLDDLDLYIRHTDKIIDLFIEEYNKSLDRLVGDLEDGIESIEEDILDTPKIIEPYDPTSIRISQGKFSLREIFGMIKGDDFDGPTLDLSPDFQRNFVWDITRKSRLIESILLEIPLPVFYLARDKDGKYQVVDGVQRLTVIEQFFSNEFKLRNLEYLSDECDNRYFQKVNATSLHPKFVRHLRSYQIDCNIIEPDTPHRVKLDIFKRLNIGGRSLNDQEVRNAILKVEVRNFIRKLANSNQFKLATDNSIKPKRMMDQELVIRFIGFYFLYQEPKLFPSLEYGGRMGKFLDNVVELLNKEYKNINFEKIEERFYIAMDNSFVMFDNYAFRKICKEYKKEDRNMINKSLFTAFAILLSDYDKDIIGRRGIILDEFANTLEGDKYLFESITYGSNDKMRIDTTFMRIEEFLKSIYGG